MANRPRQLSVETDPVADAPADTALRRPEGSERRAAHLSALHQTSGALTDTYQSDYLEQLREDWPE